MHQIILEPEEDYLDAKNLLQLIDRWYVALDVEPITLTGYKDKMIYFVSWWKVNGPAREWRLTKSALEEFEVYLRSVKSKRFKEPLSHNTRFAIMRALRMMFRWASETNRTAKNFGEWVPWPGGSTPARRATTPARIARCRRRVRETSARCGGAAGAPGRAVGTVACRASTPCPTCSRTPGPQLGSVS